MNSKINDIEDLINEPKILDDVFSRTDIQMLYRSLKKLSYHQDHKSSYHQKFYETAFVHYYNLEKLMKFSFFKKVKKAICERYNYNLLLENAYVHSYGLDQKTKVHYDNSTPTVMIYANPEWNFKWGGETIIYDKDKEIKKVILPKSGRVVVFDGNQLHCGRSTTILSPDRRYAVVFKFKFADKNNNLEHQANSFLSEDN